MGMADANKCIDLAAPLISVRRHGGDGTEPTGLPGNKADAPWEALGHTGAVPFVWEHRPGHPKSVRTRRPPPPLTIVVDEPTPVARKPAAAIVASERAREEERLSDALSRDDVVSCVTVNCSAAGLSDAASACTSGAARSPAPARRRPRRRHDGPLPPGRARRGRRLPAEHLQEGRRSARDATRASRAARTGAGDRSSPAPRRLPVQHVAAYQYHYHLPPLPPEGKEEEEEEEDDDDDAESDAHSTAGFESKRCGWLPTRCVKGALLRRRRGTGRSLLSSGGGSQKETNSLLRRSRNGQQHAGDDPGMQSWEEIYIKSLLRSGGGGGGLVMGPAAAVASELDRTVRELYKHRGGQAAVKPKASHLGLLLVLDRSNEDPGRGYHRSSPQKLPKTGGAGDYGFPLLLEGKEAVAARETALSPQPPLPASPTESWLSRALPSVSTRPPATSFLGLHVQSKKHAPLPWCAIDLAGNDVDHDGQRQRRLHDLQK